MSDNIIDIFDRYGNEKNLKDKPPLPKKPKRKYQCFNQVDSYQTYLRLHTHYQATVLRPYAYLSEAFLYADENRIDLLYKNINLAEVIAGRNLQGLIELLQDQQLRAIHCFIEDKHLSPQDSGPVITKIHGLSLDDYFEAIAAAQKRAAADSVD